MCKVLNIILWAMLKSFCLTFPKMRDIINKSPGERTRTGRHTEKSFEKDEKSA